MYNASLSELALRVVGTDTLRGFACPGVSTAGIGVVFEGAVGQVEEEAVKGRRRLWDRGRVESAVRRGRSRRYEAS